MRGSFFFPLFVLRHLVVVLIFVWSFAVYVLRLYYIFECYVARRIDRRMAGPYFAGGFGTPPPSENTDPDYRGPEFLAP